IGAVAGWLASGPLNLGLRWLFGTLVPRLFKRKYGPTRVFRVALPATVVVLFVYVGFLGLTLRGYSETPTGFIPAQDMGYLMVNVQLPDSASQERTDQVMKKIEAAALGLKVDGGGGVM